MIKFAFGKVHSIFYVKNRLERGKQNHLNQLRENNSSLRERRRFWMELEKIEGSGQIQEKLRK